MIRFLEIRKQKKPQTFDRGEGICRVCGCGSGSSRQVVAVKQSKVTVRESYLVKMRHDHDHDHASDSCAKTRRVKSALPPLLARPPSLDELRSGVLFSSPWEFRDCSPLTGRLEQASLQLLACVQGTNKTPGFRSSATQAMQPPAGKLD